ncbi:hypothetical protein M3Y97_01111200 [Aphelenchoides bicaudatus]|nr:hypothetical protein M3Y97_01111200 [Aphelenchoides bicaudatus]
MNGQNHFPHTARAYRSNSSVQSPILSRDGNDWVVQFFQYRTVDFLYDLRKCSDDRRYSENNFAQKLRSRWNDAKQRHAINYDLNCMYKLLDGEYNFSMQLNVERGTLRRKPMRFQSIVQPFNSHRWNFTKLKTEEVLYYVRCQDKPITEDPLDTHSICVNASPLESAHCLLVPSLSKCLPQIMNESGIRIATDFMLLVEDENFHVLYNSLLGQASVNHLHLHTIFWPYESDLIYRKFEPLSDGCFIIRRPDWFISTFAYQLKDSQEFDLFVKNVWRTLNFLTRRNIAHNVFFTRAPPIRSEGPLRDENTRDLPLFVTVYIFPRQCHTGAKPATNFNPAALELSGCLASYTYQFFETASEPNILRIFEEDAVVDDDEFERLADELNERLAGRIQWAAPVHIPTPQEQRRMHYLHVESADSTGEYELTELEEMTDKFHAVQFPVPLRHHHSFNLGNQSQNPAGRRRTHTTEGTVSFSKPDATESNKLDEE